MHEHDHNFSRPIRLDQTHAGCAEFCRRIEKAGPCVPLAADRVFRHRERRVGVG